MQWAALEGLAGAAADGELRVDECTCVGACACVCRCVCLCSHVNVCV